MDMLTQNQVADLLGVKVRTLRQWRERDREAGPTAGGKLRRLFPIKPSRPTAASIYRASDVVAFCQENPEYQQRLLLAADFLIFAVPKENT